MSARILVVDDQPNIVDMLATVLRFHGFAVDTAGTVATSCRTRPRCCPGRRSTAVSGGYDLDTGSNVVDTYVGYLRRKLDGLGPPLLVTHRGFGYALRAGKT